VAQYINAMDIVAAPSQTTKSWKEQFGRMLIEAMACGVNVVGSDSGEIPFVIGDAGEVVAEADVPAWTRTLGALIESPARRNELASRGRERAEKSYAWPIVAQRHLDFFESLLSHA
jgi:glycosyltransferase involved in cell wall biosynthesis